jgi:hypothetical protein
LYRALSTRLRTLDETLDPNAARASAITHLFDFNNELFLRAIYYRSRSDQNWINRGRITPEIIASVDTMRTETLQLPEDNIEALARLVRRLEESGVRVDLVVSPYLPAYRDRLDNYSQWLADLSARLDGHAIFDFSTSVSDTQAFADRRHMNVRGSDLLLDHLTVAGIIRPGLPARATREPRP